MLIGFVHVAKVVIDSSATVNSSRSQSVAFADTFLQHREHGHCSLKFQFQFHINIVAAVNTHDSTEFVANSL